MTPPEEALRERLLAVMDRKHHRGWRAFTLAGLTRAQLAVHFAQEFAVYVRDFPVLLARILGHGPPDDVRRALAENVYEEQTGRLSGGVPHPELFLRMIDGLAIDRRDIVGAGDAHAAGGLLPSSTQYRAFLDNVSLRRPWVVGAAVLTIFVEGSVHEREELGGTRILPPIEAAIAAHPMVRHYGCPPEAMGLMRAHRAVEAGHRRDAWSMVLVHAAGHEQAIVEATEQALARWLAYRDGVCGAAGIAMAPDLPSRDLEPWRP